MKKLINIVVILMITISLCYSQKASCGFNSIFVDKTKKDLIDKALIEVSNESTSILREESCIPVVFHIVSYKKNGNISDQVILNQLELLNQDFNGENEDIKNVPDEFTSKLSKKGIRFCLATKVVDEKSLIGIIRKTTNIEEIGLSENLYFDNLGGSNSWDSEYYLNVWIADTGEYISGFGTYPDVIEDWKQGVVINPQYFGEQTSSRYNKGRTLVHEIGHYLGLDHVNGDNSICENDDGVEDTPLQSVLYEGCPPYPQITCESSDMFMNYMNYVDDDCMVMFTEGQMNRMLGTLELYRPNLLSNNLCIDYQLQHDELIFDVFPNPASEFIIVDFGNKFYNLSSIKVVSKLGQVIFQNDSILHNTLEIDVSYLPEGVYFIIIGSSSKKFVKI